MTDKRPGNKIVDVAVDLSVAAIIATFAFVACYRIVEWAL